MTGIHNSQRSIDRNLAPKRKVLDSITTFDMTIEYWFLVS